MNRKQKLGVLACLILFVVAIVGMFWTPYSSTQMNAGMRLQAPSLTHWMGTDNLGRDVFSRVMGGMGTTFIIAVVTVAIGAVFGTILGALTGYFGGMLDEILMRINDGVLAFPSLLLALIFVAVLGTGKYNVIVALGILFIPSFARVIRSEYVKLRNMDYVRNAKIMGASSLRILFVHILPNTKNSLLPCIAIGFNNAVLAEASMSYLGLGVQPPEPSLGRMLSEAQTYLFTAPWYAIGAGLMIVLTLLAFGALSDS